MAVDVKKAHGLAPQRHSPLSQSIAKLGGTPNRG
jgi:hypothetical protein